MKKLIVSFTPQDYLTEQYIVKGWVNNNVGWYSSIELIVYARKKDAFNHIEKLMKKYKPEIDIVSISFC
jgi:hypothetical protein